MTNHLRAVEEALYHWERRELYDRQAKYDAAVALGEWNVYSNRQIATFTGLRPATVNQLVPKSNKSGGTLEPEALPLIRDLILGERTPETIKAALDAGCSSTMLARLTGLSQSMISRWTRTLDSGQTRRAA